MIALADETNDLGWPIARLATVCAVLERLHTSANRRQLLDAIEDIVINVVGADQFALFELDRSGAHLNLTSSFGLDPAPLRQVGFGEGLLGRVSASARLFLNREEFLNEAPLWEQTLNACIPLTIGRRLTGVIAIFGVRPDKSEFTDVDLEVFELLSRHAALALSAKKE